MRRYIMALLDPADVPLHTAKQFKYIGDARWGGVQADPGWLESTPSFKLLIVKKDNSAFNLNPCVSELAATTARGGAVKPLFQNLADVCFYVFGVSFFVMRLVLYPYIVWSALFEAARYFEYDAGAWACVVLLYILLLLQVYWFALIVKVAIKAAKGEEAQDVRSDDEEEEDDKQKKKKK